MPLRFDLLMDNCLFVEGKAAESVPPIQKTTLLSYMKLLDIPLGLVINLQVLKLTEGVLRLIYPGTNLEWVRGGDGGNEDLPLCFLRSLLFMENAGILRMPKLFLSHP